MIAEIEVTKGDITKLDVDAIVNAANKSLMGGGGVDGAIHRKAGPELYEECKELREHEFKEGLRTGDACVTKGYKLPARFVIHTVGPVYSEKEDRSGLLAAAFRNSLDRAEELQLATVAFPAISTGAYGYPVRECAQVAKEVVEKYHSRHVHKVVFCLYTDKDYEVFSEEFKEVAK